MKKVNVFTTAGGKFVDWYKSYTLPSLSYDIERLRNGGYTVELVHNGFSIEEDKHQQRSTVEVQTLLLTGLRNIIQKTIDEDALFFMAPPDQIYSIGTLYNSVMIGDNQKYACCVAIPHTRINPIMDKLPTAPISSPNLATIAIQLGHSSFLNSFDNVDNNCTWAGISIKKLNDKLYAISHCLPTICLAKFTPGDLSFWQTCLEFSAWDRGWLSSVFNQDRLKVIGSSDIGCYVEITDPNITPLCRPGLLHNEAYYTNSNHNKALSKFVFSLRLE
jgi:hypothetical protein